MAMENTNIIGKRISDLCSVYSIKSDDLLIISYRLDDPNQVLYKSKKITFGDFTKKFEADIEKYIKSISSELSTRVKELFIHIDSVSSQVVFEIGKIKDTAISDITTISSEVTEKVKDLSGSVQEMSSIVEYAKSELWKCAALSTLNYFTFIGDDISKLPEVSGHLSSVSSDILWFDTTDDETAHQIRTTKRIDNLQSQIYSLGLQIKDFHKVLENGVIPGNAYNSTKDEMVRITDITFPPDESITQSQDLLEMNIYGNYYCKNSENYYLMFNPSGFYPISTHFMWFFSNHDTDNNNVKTYLHISSEQGSEISSFNYLKATLNDKILSSTAQISFKAAVKYNSEPPTEQEFTKEQNVIDGVIRLLSANNNHKMNINVSSDYYDEQFGENISSEYEIEMNVGTNEKPVADMEIIGSDYVDYTTLYYSVVNEIYAKQPLNLNINWYFLSSYYDEEGQQHLLKSDYIVKKVYHEDKSTTEYGYATFKIIRNIGTPFCQVSVWLDNCTQQQAKSVSALLQCESLYDNSLSACKRILGIGGVVPNSEDVEPTVKSVCAKYDSKSNFIEKKTSMRNGEIVYFKDTDQLAVFNNGKFMTLNSSSSSGLSKEEIQDIGLDYLTFSKDPTGNVVQKMAFTNDGKFHSIQKVKDETQSVHKYDETWGVYVSNLLQIGKAYSGGKAIDFNTDIISGKKVPQSLVSHNFVELVNASNSDIPLDRIYLMYHTDDSDFYKIDPDSGNSQWQFIKLQGNIKAHGTYLIRGAECNPCSNTMIKVKSCDMEWRKRKQNDQDILNEQYKKCTRSGDLIEFSPKEGTFFLIYATDNSSSDGYGYNVKKVITGQTKPTEMTSGEDKSVGGYIDLIGLQGSIVVPNGFYQSAAYKSPTNTLNNLIVSSWFYMDPSRQGNKALKDRKNSTLLTGVDLERHKIIYPEEMKNQKRDNLYYEDDYKMKFTPSTSERDDYGIFRCRSSFNDDKPNAINITFGIQATDASSNGGKKASRCFNWISNGYHDEYIMYRKVNETGGVKTYGDYKTVYSITAANNEKHISPFHKFYDRVRWTSPDGKLVTTHKVILKNCLESGTYEFYIGRDGSNTYKSDVLEFSVKSDSEVENFSVIQTSDQQGFNWIEYQAWKASCEAISRQEKNFDFTINTGDIAQSGNRQNEWIDYYEGRRSLGSMVEMFTIGNNDLCGSPPYVLGDGEDDTSKFNLVNVYYYYTFELDVDNPPFSEFEYQTGKTNKYPIYSLYSFDYGQWHFISVVSEIRKFYAYAFSEITEEARYQGFANKLNSDVENWFKRDLSLYMSRKGETDCSKCIVYMHEMPFTMVTPDFFDLKDSKWGTKGRTTDTTGCKLNLENKFGNYRFSRLFMKSGIRLIMGGHKHTFSLSNPLYDCSQNNVLPDERYHISSDTSNEDPFISSVVDGSLSHKPFIQIPISGTQRFIDNKLSNEIFELISKGRITQQEFNGLSSIVENARNNVGNQDLYNSIMNELMISSRTLDITSFNNIDQNYNRLSDFIRIHFVDTINAPTYVMSQATGYKVVSNKELPSALSDKDNICRYTPWLMSYCAALKSEKTSEGKESGNFTSTKNPVQCRPTYVRYDFTENDISVCIKQVDGVYNIKPDDGSYPAYTLENQTAILSCKTVTFGKYGTEISAKYFIPTTLSDYMELYSDYINGDTYIIKI